jgi:hypothetical protein
MTFDSHHYVPVLKVKRGEKAALSLIDPSLRERITPLLEIVERKPEKTLKAHLETAFKGLSESVSLYSRCFLDTREIAPDGATAAADVFRMAANLGFVFTPVTGISRKVDVGPALEHATNSVAVRITKSEFETGNLSSMVEKFMNQHKLEPDEVDLIVDLGSVENLIADGIARLTTAFLDDVPHLNLWRTFTLCGSAFPKSMKIIDKHSYDFVRREEWIAWRDYLYARRDNILRLPAFSDCAIQHPSGVEGFDPLLMQVSASIRYTRSDDWLLIKGESTRFKAPSQQFPLLAARLVFGDLRQYFLGSNHCHGCDLMQAAANGAPKLGSAEAWRKLGTIHHLSVVMQNLDSLLWS